MEPFDSPRGRGILAGTDARGVLLLRGLKGSALVSLLGCVLFLTAACANPNIRVPVTPTATPPPTPTAAKPQPSQTAVPPQASPTPVLLPSPIAEDPANHWRMIFQDEFNGANLDPNRWNTELRWGRINRPELQYYSEDAVQMKDGILRITADKQPVQGMEYTSGAVATFWHFWFQYGYVEMRAKVPSGKGLWPAFWLLAHDENSASEIDIMDIRGQEPQVVHTTLHYNPGRVSDQENADYRGPDFSQGFHTFAVRWEPNVIIWYVDGTEVFRVTDHVPQESMDVMVNLAVGGEWPGNPDASTVFPAYMDVDYVRIYSHY